MEIKTDKKHYLLRNEKGNLIITIYDYDKEEDDCTKQFRIPMGKLVNWIENCINGEKGINAFFDAEALNCAVDAMVTALNFAPEEDEASDDVNEMFETLTSACEEAMDIADSVIEKYNIKE